MYEVINEVAPELLGLSTHVDNMLTLSTDRCHFYIYTPSRPIRTIQTYSIYVYELR